MRNVDDPTVRGPGWRAAIAGAVALLGGLVAILGAHAAAASQPSAAPPDSTNAELAEIVVTATRVPERSFDLPVSIDRVDRHVLRDGQLRVNMSESLGIVPGLSVQNRQNYAQDLQLSVRGFGARSSFGVRGVRLYADGIPGTMPDGQGQFSHFDLGAAGRIEVMRGPFSALYGNSSGGVISIFTEDGMPGFGVEATAGAGSLGTQRYSLEASGDSGETNYVIDGGHFETDGYRDHSRAERNTGNAKVRLALGTRSALTLVANAIETPAVQDPLGLTRAQFAANPRQAGTNALLYNTRKSLSQEQAGVTLTSALTDADEITAMAYGGRRRTTQFQAILQAVEANPLHPGGVIDLGRDYRGGDVHLTDRRSPGGMPLTLTAGLSYDKLEEARRGYLNFAGSELGVFGALRRDEGNQVGAADGYLQIEWDPAARWRAIAGVRHSQIDVTSRDHLAITPPTGVRYTATDPVAGITYRIRPTLNAYASYGRGFETPTLNDLAYRSTDGSLPGLNFGLQPARSDNYELGVKAGSDRFRSDLAAFYVKTRNELAVEANSAGRSVFENIGGTERRGAELSLAARATATLDVHVAYTYIRAVTTVAYTSCAGLPCVPVVIPAGKRLPAVAGNSLYAGVTWHAPRLGFSATAETVARAQIYVDDRNIDAARGYWSTNIRAGFVQSGSGWTFSETARIDNLAGRQYVSTVIVNESNARYFEPSSGRTAYLLFTAARR